MAGRDSKTYGDAPGGRVNGIPARDDSMDTPGVRTKHGIVNGELVRNNHEIHEDSLHGGERPRTAANDVDTRPGKALNREQTRGEKNMRVK